MIFGSFHTGQSLAKSQQDKFYTMKNVDAFTNLGNAQCQNALVSDSTTPNEDCIQSVAPNGDVYHFSTESGKTWKIRPFSYLVRFLADIHSNSYLEANHGT